MKEITTYREFTGGSSPGLKARNIARKMAIAGLSRGKKLAHSGSWIRFPYYHHVFDDEKKDFERQLQYLSNFGEFISMDRAVDLINSSEELDGRYFCVSFDDGFYNCYSNMAEVASSMQVPVIIYLATEFVGLRASDEADAKKILQFNGQHGGSMKPVSFMSWDECRELQKENISFGSHTLSHANLSKLSNDEIDKELKDSKAVIEKELGTECRHFACPWGRKNIDFDVEIAPGLARRAGYHSFATTNRGKMLPGDDPFLLHRDHLIAGWENFQLRYFFGE